jgi:hypothetical protein
MASFIVDFINSSSGIINGQIIRLAKSNPWPLITSIISYNFKFCWYLRGKSLRIKNIIVCLHPEKVI